MVMLQVEHVNRLFEEITTLRAANWVEVNNNPFFYSILICCYYYILIPFKNDKHKIQLLSYRTVE
jgi:hypothetical protein